MIMILILMMKVIGKYVNVLSSRFGNDNQDDTDHTGDDYNDYDDEYDDVSVVDGRERGHQQIWPMLVLMLMTIMMRDR